MNPGCPYEIDNNVTLIEHRVKFNFLGKAEEGVILNQKSLCVPRLSKGWIFQFPGTPMGVTLEFLEHVLGVVELTRKTLRRIKFVIRIYFQYFRNR